MRADPAAVPYWRLSSFYFFYFATLGALIPYWGLYLRSLGFDAVEIGRLMALLLATKIIAPNLWSWIADHTHAYMGVVRLAAALSLLCYLGVYYDTSFWALALVMASFSFFWNASLPQIEASTLNFLGADQKHYGRIRVWGSVGFIVLVLALGPFVDHFGPRIVLPVIAALLVGIWLATMIIPQAARPAHQHVRGSLIRVLRQPPVLAFLGACFLMQVSHAPFYTFYSIYLADYGYSKTVIGFLWALGVLCEVGVFMSSHRLFGRFDLASVLAASFFVTALRWVLVACCPQSLAMMMLTQAMHAVTFGAYHAAAIQLIHRFFHGPIQHRGQALYSSLSFGVGGAIGSAVGGHAWTGIGPQWTFIACACLALVGLALAWVVRHGSLAADAGERERDLCG